jgi:hypothetical protein
MSLSIDNTLVFIGVMTALLKDKGVLFVELVIDTFVRVLEY